MDNSLTIMFMGDIMLGELLENIGRGVKSKIEKGVDPFKYVKKTLLEADLVIGNLECVLSDVSSLRKPFSLTLRVAPEYAKVLSDNNIKLVNLANNHTKDHGNEAFISTLNALSKYEINHFGYSMNYDFQTKPVLTEIKSIKLGFLGYNLANKSNAELDLLKNNIIEIIKKSKKEADILILSLHWGLEYTSIPSIPYTSLARDFISAGADIIYGHHSHVLQGVVMDDDKVIAFSLGNFIFDDLRGENRFTSILEIEIDIIGKKIKSQKLHPIFINRNFQPVPVFAKKDTAYVKTLSETANLSYHANTTSAKTIYNKALKMSKMGHMKNRVRIRIRILCHIRAYYKFTKNLLLYKRLCQKVER